MLGKCCWRGRHPSAASSDADLIKRMKVSKLCDFLSNLKPEPLLCSKQCGLLIDAMKKIAAWLALWARTAALPASFVQDLLTLAAKGIRLLDKFVNLTPSSWLTMAASRMESREEFEELFTGFVQALSSYVQLMQGPLSHASGLPLIISQHLFSPGNRDEICRHAASLIAELKKDFRLLHLKAAEDRRDLFDRLEQGNFREGEESRVAQLLMERLDGKHERTEPLRLNSSGIMYKKLNNLGEGIYGVVYEAIWMGMKVAVKQFRDQNSLLGELDALCKTSHVNIMRAIAYHLEMEGSNSGLLMELMKGDLSQFVLRIKDAKSKLPLSVLIDILLQIATGMAYLHRVNIMHRDLKPENILFTRWPPMSADELHKGPGDFTVKVADFGEARTDAHDTMHATAKLGTRCYRAPEILYAVDGLTAKYSNKVDVYSFGMVCFKLLTLSEPELSKDKALQGDYSELQFPSSVPLGLMFLMKRCLVRAHHKRPSFDEICEFLALFKSILLSTVPIEGCRAPLYMRIGDDMLKTLVGFLGEEWLLEEAIQLGIRPEFMQGADRVEIDGVSLRQQVMNKLAAFRTGDYQKWVCW